MGCSHCRGHAGQVCSRPDCRDESADVEREYAAREREVVEPALVCGRCRAFLLPLTSAMNGYRMCLNGHRNRVS